MIKIEAHGIEHTISKENKPFIIAELSGNHDGSVDKALKLVDEAAAAGVDAGKIQTYTADTMTLNIDRDEFLIDDPKSLWHGYNLYQLYEKASTPWDWHEPIFERCADHGIIGFSSPFDASAVDFLESINVPMYKIASFELTDLPLVKKVAQTGKPLVMSTGMATVAEIMESVETARSAGCRDLALLKCTSAYPANPEDIHLNTIPHMRELFNCEVGLSDHTLGLGASVASVALGASIIEKHFTLDRSEGGVDSAFSLEPKELKDLVSECASANKALGIVNYKKSSEETLSATHRRSIYASSDIKAGEIFSDKNVKVIRPGLGLKPKHYEDVLGKKATTDIAFGTPLNWGLIKSV